MYLGSTSQTQSLGLTITTMIFWFKIEDDERCNIPHFSTKAEVVPSF